MAEDAKLKDGMIELDFSDSVVEAPSSPASAPVAEGLELRSESPLPRESSPENGLQEEGGTGLDLSLVFSPGDIEAAPSASEVPPPSPDSVSTGMELDAAPGIDLELGEATAVEKPALDEPPSTFEPSSPSEGEGDHGTARHVDLSRIELLDVVSAAEKPLELAPLAPPPPAPSEPVASQELHEDLVAGAMVAPPPPHSVVDNGPVSPEMPAETPASLPMDAPSEAAEPAPPVSETLLTSDPVAESAASVSDAPGDDDQQLAMPEPTMVGEVPPARSPRGRILIFSLAGVLALGVLALTQGQSLLELVTGPSEEETVVAEPGDIEAPEESGAEKPQSPVKAKGKMKAREKLAAAPLPQPTPARSFQSSKNRDYFAAIEQAISNGNPAGAVKAFKRPLSGGLAPEDRVVASEFEARYYLLVGKAGRAVDALAPHCQSPASQPTACVHYLRALISTRQFDAARSLLAKVRGAEAWSSHKAILSLCDLALRAGVSPNQETVRALVTHALGELNLPSEWYRQRTAWLARSVFSLSRAERANLSRFYLSAKREMLLGGLKNADASGISATDGLLVALFNSQATQFELQRLTGVGGKNRLDSDFAVVANIFSIVARAPFESVHSINSSLAAFAGHPHFGEISRLIGAHAALNEGNVQQAWTLYTQEFPSIRSRKSKYVYEWTRVFARCVSLGFGTDSLGAALSGVVSSLKLEEGAKGDFYHWLTVAKLERLMKKKGSMSLNRAMSLAVTAHERALVGIEEARLLATLGKKREAAALVQKWAGQVPQDGFLLQAAAEMAPLGNIDASPFLEAASRVPEKFASRAVEYPVLSDLTLRMLISGL